MSRISTTKEFIRKARKVHGTRYDYAKSVYVNANTSVLIECPVHGFFKPEPRKHLRGRGCGKCKREKTIEERRKKKYLGFQELQKRVRMLGVRSCLEYETVYKQIPKAPFDPRRFYKEWKSWPDFLGFAKRSQLIADSGAICPSENHARIENFFHAHGIERQMEVHYGPFRADWRLSDGTVVEYFGIINKRKYEQTIKKKIRYCKRHRLLFVAIYPQDVKQSRLEELFREQIELSIIKRRAVPITTDKQAQEFFKGIEQVLE